MIAYHSHLWALWREARKILLVLLTSRGDRGTIDRVRGDPHANPLTTTFSLSSLAGIVRTLPGEVLFSLLGPTFVFPMTPWRFDIQGHRGARGLKPENTLPSFEQALDHGATTLETDIHVTADGVPVLFHDPCITSRLCRLRPGAKAPSPGREPSLALLTLEEVRAYRADGNPDKTRFPWQNAESTPLASRFCTLHGLDEYGIPTLADLLAFLVGYAGSLGRSVGKTTRQRRHAVDVLVDLELKRVPFRPELGGDSFDGTRPGRWEESVLSVVREAAFVPRTRIRSFDHRAVAVMRRCEPGLQGAILIAGTAPIDPAALAKAANATIYCPDHTFLDPPLVNQCHAAGIQVLPWTVNEEEDMRLLISWDVDGLTTDYPDRLSALLRRSPIRR